MLIEEQRAHGVERAEKLQLGPALERLLEEELQLEPSKRRAEAEMPAARAECLVIGIQMSRQNQVAVAELMPEIAAGQSGRIGALH